MKKTLIILSTLFLCSCSIMRQMGSDSQNWAKTRDAENVKTLLIAPYQIIGMGVGPRLCYLAKSGEEDLWQMFYASIHGFDFEPGMGYRLKVKQSPVDNLPADSSSLRYDLVEVIEKRPVVQSLHALHGNWKVVRVDGTQPVPKNVEQTLKMDTAAMTITGHGGVNRYKGRLEGTEGSPKIGFKQMMSTRMSGPNLPQESSFFKTLEKVDGYYRCDSLLLLLTGKQVAIEARILE